MTAGHTGGMARPTFPLRLRNDRVRELVRVVAEREGISQNELLEQAAEHEVIARGALLADELEVSAAQLRAATTTTMSDLVETSVVEFAAAEALPDPLRPRQLTARGLASPGSSPARRAGIGAVAAFTHH
jgi:hypothetical protein